MAQQLPIPQSPRTPTPPSDDDPYLDDEPPEGLGVHHSHGRGMHAPAPIMIDHDYDIRNNLNESPQREPYTGRTDSGASMLSPTSAVFSTNGAFSPGASQWSPVTPQTASTDGGFQSLDSAAGPNPFNFQTQQYVAGKGSIGRATDALGKRRGHKYRHSSIHTSHQIFQAPAQRTPLTVPASLPMPTRREAWWSITRAQRWRLLWCLGHFMVAGYVQLSAEGSLAMTALSRLLLFDAAGATVCVGVDVMGNFEVWKRSSIKHPFGLERADVLAGFGMAVFIGFMGLDVISHGIQHSLENLGDHVAHSTHSHERASTGEVDVASLLAIFSTLVSAFIVKNHARIGRAMRLELIAGWGKILGNPSHFLTLFSSVLLLALPLLSIKTYTWFDTVLSMFIAVLMIAFGTRLGTSLASMLLMSYKPLNDPRAVRETIESIETDPEVSSVEEARFWQVHYGLCMANLKLRYSAGYGGYGDDMMRIRQRVTNLVRSRLASAYGSGGPRWDVSVQLAVE